MKRQGHRQRGAGAVTVSRGETLRQGVMCKEWQRTPMTVLREYCQSKKRKQAYYTNVKAPEGLFRVRCVLPDEKVSSKDLVFSPEQAAPTLDEAKHCAALLAIHYLEPLLPLERKLPDPFRELWLALVAANKGSSDAKQTGKKQPASNKKKPDAKAGRQVTEAATAAAKEAPSTAAAQTDMDLWKNIPESPKSEAASKTTKQQFPTELTSDRKFASRAEYEQAQLERVQERNRKQRARENRERANMPKQVLMSAACREMIETVLQQLGMISKTDTSGESAALETAAEDHEELFQSMSKQLAKIGFQPKHVDGALRSCKKAADHSDDDFMTLILDWLCLNVPEGDLPKGFNPEGTQLDVVLTSSAPVAAVNASPMLVQRLMKIGYDRLDAVAAVSADLPEHVAGLAEDSPELTLALLQSLYPPLLKHFDIDENRERTIDVPDAEELAQSREDEMFALEAIYEDKLRVETLANGAQLLKFNVSDELELEIFLPSESKYPFELPVIALSSNNNKHQPYLLETCGAVLKNCVGVLGDPMIYDICAGVDTELQHLTKQGKQQKIVLLHKESKTPLPSEIASTPSPAPVESKKPSKSKTNRRQAPYKSRSSPYEKRVHTEAVRKLNTKLLQLRQAKDGDAGFKSMLKQRARLPAAAEKENMLTHLVNNQVVLVCGQTGCGKTTQIPQFILDDFIDSGRGGECNIICTQPRRIAAIGVATRVAQERCEAIADIVGYQIRMDAKKSANTRLLFCTTGVLLRQLLTDRSLSKVSHVIVDEVHERNIDTDFLLSILRDLLPRRPDLHLILMSATMNADLFVNYFSSSGHPSCPVLDIPGFTYPVECHFLEDIVSMASYEVPKKLLKDKKKKPSGESADLQEKDKKISELSPTELVNRIDDSRIDYDLPVHLVKYLIETRSANDNGAILIFMPGTAEIKRLMEMLNQTREISSKIWVLALHGSLSGADQALAFKTAPSGKTKIIVGTNIAETSITINDITVVIDCGKVKEMVYDNQLRRSQLLDCWASQAACDQRKGRAGRVQAGTCYRLFSRKRFSAMDKQLAAEIHRVSLEQLCLQIKKLGLGSIRSFLAKAIEPPRQDAIDTALQELISIAAFKQVAETGASIDEEQVHLTPLGNHLAMLPLDARIGKFLIYGSILRCIEPVAIIAACISSKNPFIMSMSDPELREKQDAFKKELNGNWKSDHLLLWKVVDRYVSSASGQKLKRAFCRDYGLSYDTMENIVDLKNQYLQQLDTVGFYERVDAESLNLNSSIPRIIKAALCAGLYSNVIQVVYPEQKYFQAAHGVVTEEHDAKKIRYFVRSTNAEELQQQQHHMARERVFLHPSSLNFAQTQYDSPWLLYTELVQTSKVFVRESTMVNPYALLLFGGQLDVVHEKNLIRLDKWIQFHAVARIGVLIKAIRKHLDQLLMEKIENPQVSIANSELVSAISQLLKSEGM